MEYTEALATVVVHQLTESGETLAVAESCTGGGLGAAIASIPNCSKMFLGGVICYANEVKEKVVGVPSFPLKTYGAVSKEVAIEMAKGVAKLLNADIGIGITGIAGPGGAVPDKPVGTVHIAIFKNEVVWHKQCEFEGDRATIQRDTVRRALSFLASV